MYFETIFESLKVIKVRVIAQWTTKIAVNYIYRFKEFRPRHALHTSIHYHL